MHNDGYSPNQIADAAACGYNPDDILDASSFGYSLDEWQPVPKLDLALGNSFASSELVIIF